MRAGIRVRIGRVARRAGGGLRRVSTPGLIGLLCAGAFGPMVAVAAGVTGALAAAGVGVLSSVGANYLSDLLRNVIDNLRDTEHLPTQDDFEQAFSDRIVEILERNDSEAVVLRNDIAAVLREIDASSAALAMAIETGRRDVQQELSDSFAKLASEFTEFGFLLVGLEETTRSIYDLLLQHRNELERARQQKYVSAVAKEVEALLSPSLPLDPYLQIIPFVGRERELAELTAWCEDRAAGPVRLVTGPGGVGKTRLSIQLCNEAEKRGWHTIHVAAGAEARAIADVRALVSGRLLLVVDYAETRLELRQLLRAVIDDVVTNYVGALKVLLLARAPGRWWEELRDMESAVRGLISSAYYGELRSVISDEMLDTDLIQAAVPPFAARLGVAQPEDVIFSEGFGHSRILDLHMAALTAILSAGDRGNDQVQVSIEDALVRLLGHEERFWLATARRAGIIGGLAGLSPATLRRIVAAACLYGAATRNEAIDLLKRVPEVSATDAVAAWLHDLYPPDSLMDTSSGESEWLGVLRPDRLAEHLTVNELCDSSEFADSCFGTNISPRQGFRAAALLGRARIDDPRAEPFFEKVLQSILYYISHHPDLVEPDTIMMVADLIPYSALRLMYTSTALKRLYDQAGMPDGSDRWKRFLAKLSDYLAKTMRRLEDFPPAVDESTYQGTLASAFPPVENVRTRALRKDLEDTYPSLARNLALMGVVGSKGSLEEAAAIYRGLAEVYPDRYILKLIRTLTNLRQILSQQGLDSEAQEVHDEAVRLRKKWKDMVRQRQRSSRSVASRLP